MVNTLPLLMIMWNQQAKQNKLNQQPETSKEETNNKETENKREKENPFQMISSFFRRITQISRYIPKGIIRKGKTMERQVSGNDKAAHIALKEFGMASGILGVVDREYIRQELKRMDRNYVISDIDGKLHEEFGERLEMNGYRVKVLDLEHPNQSDGYNSLVYVRDDRHIKMLAQCILENTEEHNGVNEGLYRGWEEALLQAIMGYACETSPKEGRSMCGALEKLHGTPEKGMFETMDQAFAELEKENPDSQAVKYYRVFRSGTVKYLKAIAISVGVRLAPFNVPLFRDITDKDTMELEGFSREKIAVFIIPGKTSDFDFFTSMIFTQAFEEIREAYSPSTWTVPTTFFLDGPDGRLPVIPGLLSMAGQGKYGISWLTTTLFSGICPDMIWGCGKAKGRKYVPVYGKSFLAAPDKDVFLPNGRRVTMLSLMFECHIKDEQTGEDYCFDDAYNNCGEEVLCDEDGNWRELVEAFRCSYDRDSETGYKLTKEYETPGTSVEFIPQEGKCYAWFGKDPDFGEPVDIPYSVLCQTLLKYPEAFDTLENRYASCDVFDVKYVKD